ncbi:ATP-binding protein [Candidatus Pacearchaeota archaeon]|nr:ATP-binding protein [Candidatus Pacearchaeota archaeon]
MRREDISFVLFAQQKDFEEEKPIIKRQIVGKALDLIKLNLPLVITGVRRCGKSYLLKIIKDELKLKNKEYLYINFNDDRLANFEIEDFQKILDFVHEQRYDEKCFFFIDEIQEVERWEKWIDRIKENHKIVITGSNSKLLSSEISTILTGRSLSLWLTPLSFKEFLDAKKIFLEDWKIDLKKQAIIRSAFSEYLQDGGFPKRVLTGKNIIIKELYEQILYRDIADRFGKGQTKAIKEISVNLLSKPSSLVSIRQISSLTNIKNLGTVKSILDAFENAFLFFFVNKFDFSVKKQIQNPRKVYSIDNGIPSHLGFRMSGDKGKLLENLTAIELKRREKDIFYYSDKNECDFIIRERNEIAEAIQVCYNLTEENKQREINGLLGAMEKFKLRTGLILTQEQEEEIKINGKIIEVIPVWKWLLQGVQK